MSSILTEQSKERDPSFVAGDAEAYYNVQGSQDVISYTVVEQPVFLSM